jgi:hypothetical protein
MITCAQGSLHDTGAMKRCSRLNSSADGAFLHAFLIADELLQHICAQSKEGSVDISRQQEHHGELS